MLAFVWCFLSTQFLREAWGQDLPSTSSWRKPAITASPEERVRRTHSAIDVFIQLDDFFHFPVSLPGTSWPYGEFLALMADYDIYTGQTRYKDVAQRHYLPAFHALVPTKSRYGYAAARAYMAWKDERFLAIAQNYWTETRLSTVSAEDVLTGKAAGKNDYLISKTCTNRNNATLEGGTFRTADMSNDRNLTVSATGDYMALTLSLGLISSNQSYFDLAKSMGRFLQTVAYSEKGLFFTWIDPQEGKDCPMGYGGMLAYDIGSAIQGLSLLASITKDASIMTFLKDVAVGATTNTSWHDQNGVLNTTFLETFSSRSETTQHLLRSYLDLAAANDTPSDLKTYIQQYLGVQYNAAVDLATSGGSSNIYGSALLGPAGTQFKNSSQALAIAALLGGMVSSGTGSLNPTPGDSPESNSSSGGGGRSTPVAPIVGGAIGGVFGILLLIGIAYFYRRRHRRSIKAHNYEPEYRLDPYGVTKPTAQTPSPTVERSPISPLSSRKTRRWTAVSSGQGISPTDTEATGPLRQGSTREATTAELVMVLNDRLRSERWDSNESPPEYPRSDR
ncbi:hypothetical protein V5O48_012706 [Marasmius crinis-equi]|uniref:Glycoside hydrolase family 76 protein n=1 Tax=Marasmius crinis-equi TaxID=585013 RepID=A0ABR3F2C4_9AGAR